MCTLGGILLNREGDFHGYAKESIAQALSVGFRENQARPESFASENRN
jgi:hypothetical protein